MVIKKILKTAWNEIIYGGHLLSLGAIGLLISVSLLLSKPVSWDYLLIVYLIVYNSYLFNRYQEQETDLLTNPERTLHFKKYASYTPLISGSIFLTILGILIGVHKLNFAAWFILLFFSGMIYSIGIKQYTAIIPFFKNIVVAAEWVLPITLLPVYFSDFRFNTSLIILMIIVYLKVFILTSYFDIKDTKSDRQFKLLTLPTTFSVKTSLWILTVLILVFGGVIVYSVWRQFLPMASLLLLLTLPWDWVLFFETVQV